MSKTYSSAPEQFLDANKKYQVTMKTSDGDMTIELFNKETPIAANNFAFLVKEGFYDGLSFHRIIKGFMIQGGDPSGDGTGGPGYEIKDEPVTRDYKRGVIAYANSGANTSGSQFFIMHADYPLPKQYTIFGQVVSGLETIDKIADTPVEGNMYGEQSTPTEPVFIESARLNEVQ
ncbi:peptidylprolyl isomerase [candidate division WWE3 bacterium]|nr:peptidylprolyl isomerase [candidate division WWE3 bacterium]